VRKDASSRKVAARRNDEPQAGIVDYVVGCLRDPRVLTAVGAEGLEGRRVVWQLAAAFAIVTFVVSVVRVSLVLGFSAEARSGVAPQAFLTPGFGLEALAGGLVGLVSAVAGLFVEAVAFWFVAGVTASKARFGALLTGLAFVQVMSAVVLLLLALAAGLSLLVGLSAATAVQVLAVGYFLVMVVYLVFYAVGVFDVGCIGSFVLALVAAVCASALQHAIPAALGALSGG